MLKGTIAPESIQIRAPGPLDHAAIRLAILVYVGVESFKQSCQTGELDFDVWSRRVRKRLADQQIEASEDELKWLQTHLPYEPNVKAYIHAARTSLNARLADKPALPVGATLALFMKGNIKTSTKNADRIQSVQVEKPTALITLTEPLRFVCQRGTIFEVQESPVVAWMDFRTIPGRIENPSLEVERFVLESEEDFWLDDRWVYLRYPSLNKAHHGIFNRLHLREGRQNTNGNIYNYSAWVTQDSNGQTEYYPLKAIRDRVLKRTWEYSKLPRNRGRAEEAARALLIVLRARGIRVPDFTRERILAEKEPDRLDAWLETAAIAASVAEMLDYLG